MFVHLLVKDIVERSTGKKPVERETSKAADRKQPTPTPKKG